MGTRGYYVFCYKGKYYVFYNHWDSYMEGLGEDIVKELRTMKEEDFEYFKTLLEKIPIDTKWEGEGDNFKGLKKALEDPANSRLVKVTGMPPTNDMFVQYIYTINLDEKRFEIMWHGRNPFPSIQKFWLKNIPEDWCDLCYEEC